MFEKIMTLPDALILRFFDLCTDLHPDQVKTCQMRLENGENPRSVKMELAQEIVRLYHGEARALEARNHFDLVFRDKGIPENIPVLEALPFCDEAGLTDLVKIVVKMGFAPSSSEARRLISQGGARLNSAQIREFKAKTRPGDVLQVGKRNFVRLL